MKKIQPQRHVLMLRKDDFNSLLQIIVDNFRWYYAKTRSTFFKYRWKVKSKTILTTFHAVILKYTPVTCTLNKSFPQA